MDDIEISNELNDLFSKASLLIDTSRNAIGTFVNMLTVYTNYQIGKYIIIEEQKGNNRAKYGSKILDSLSAFLTEKYGRGFSRSNVAGMRQFYLTYKDRDLQIVQSSIGQLTDLQKNGILQSQPGQLVVKNSWPFKLSWTHYQVLMRITDADERCFYEQEAVISNWSVKTLKRQYQSSLYERLALSRNKADVIKLANKDNIPYKPEDILHTPYVLEFTGLEDKASYHESDLENAILSKLQDFMLEMGKGFLFEKRQKRFVFNEKSYYLDLVLKLDTCLNGFLL